MLTNLKQIGQIRSARMLLTYMRHVLVLKSWSWQSKINKSRIWNTADMLVFIGIDEELMNTPYSALDP